MKKTTSSPSFKFRYLICFLWVLPLWGTHLPSDHDAGDKSGSEFESSLRLFHREGNFNFKFEYKKGEALSDLRPESFTLGTYYKFHRQFKLGIFTRRQSGVRHDEDWINPGTGWTWEEVNQRKEQVYIASLKYRKFLDFIPKGDWLGQIETIYEYNQFNEQRTLKLRPSIVHPIFKDGEPFVNVFLRGTVYLPQNYSQKDIYQKWIYAGLLWHAKENMKVSLFAAHHTTTWTATDSFIAKHNEGYEAEHKSKVLGLSLIFKIP